MGKIIAFEWVSADGVFDAALMEEWFFPYDSEQRRKLIKETYERANALLMGRTTYEMLAPYWGGLPDDDKDGLAGLLARTPKFIASEKPPVADWGETTMLKGDIQEAVKKLKSGVETIMIIGSAALSASLAKAGLIDEYKLLVHPFVMGTGKGFFREEMKTALQLVEIQQHDQDILLLHYRVKR